jgi:TonB family protein
MLSSPKRSALLSAALHAGAILLVLALTGVKIPVPAPVQERLVVPIEIGIHRATAAKGGGSGGTHSPTRASIGRPPKPSPHPFTPPLLVPEIENPKLTIEPAILASADTKLPTIDLAQFGDIFGAHGPPSNGIGDGGGIGNRHGTGDGDGNGPGFGDGPGGGFRGGNGTDGWLTAPVLLWKNEPEFSEEARRAKIQGTVMLRIEIDQRGQVRNVSVTHGLGLGLDERAIDAVRHWRFRPATRNGKPAVSSALVEVNFRLL